MTRDHRKHVTHTANPQKLCGKKLRRHTLAVSSTLIFTLLIFGGLTGPLTAAAAVRDTPPVTTGPQTETNPTSTPTVASPSPSPEPTAPAGDSNLPEPGPIEVTEGPKPIAPRAAAQELAATTVTAADFSGAQWITHPDWQNPSTQPAALPLLAQNITARTVTKATLSITGLGVYNASINGRALTTGGKAPLLSPGYSTYAKRAYYQQYDVTSLMRDGSNRLGIALGGGAYDNPETPNRYQKFFGSFGTIAAIAKLTVTDANGTRSIVTDPSWKTTLGPTTTASWFGGEDYDARREPGAWKFPATSLATWQDATAVAMPSTMELTAQTQPPIVATNTYAPVSVTRRGATNYIIDFGRIITGVPQLNVTAPSGTKITISPGSKLTSTGAVADPDTNTASTDAPLTFFDSVTTANSNVVWSPQFVYHSFRYLDIKSSVAITSDNVQAIEMMTNNRKVGNFASSTSLFNTIDSNIDTAIRGNMQSVYTDTPNREKLGWLEQTHNIFETTSMQYDVHEYSKTMMQQMADAQNANGMVPTTAPQFTTFGLPESSPFTNEPFWGATFVLLPLSLYETYGDMSTMRLYYDDMLRYKEYLDSRASNSLLNFGLGDWASNVRSASTTFMSTVAYYRVVSALETQGKLLGKDTTALAQQRATIAAALNSNFVNATTGSVDTNTLASYAIALDAGFLTSAAAIPVRNRLVYALTDSHYLTNIGEVALPSLLRALSAMNRDDLVHRMLTATDLPSYGYQVKQGANSLTEYWDAIDGRYGSWNHVMMGAASSWFKQELAGIQQAPGTVGFTKIVIDPFVGSPTTSARATYQSAAGTIASSWSRSNAGIRMDVTIPLGASATILVPVTSKGTITVPGGATLVSRSGAQARYSVTAGTYTFATNDPSTLTYFRPTWSEDVFAYRSGGVGAGSTYRISAAEYLAAGSPALNPTPAVPGSVVITYPNVAASYLMLPSGKQHRLTTSEQQATVNLPKRQMSAPTYIFQTRPSGGDIFYGAPPQAPRRLTYDQWATMGQPFGYMRVPEYYRYSSNSAEVFADVAPARRIQVSAADFATAGAVANPRAHEAIIRFAWSNTVYLVTDTRDGTMRPLTLAEWNDLGTPTPAVVTTYTGVKFEQLIGTPLKSFTVKGGVKTPLSDANWRIAGSPPLTQIGPVNLVKFPWSDALFQVASNTTGGAYKIDFATWSAMGFASYRTVTSFPGSSFTRDAASPDIYWNLPTTHREKLTFTQWSQAGYPNPTVTGTLDVVRVNGNPNMYRLLNATTGAVTTWTAAQSAAVGNPPVRNVKTLPAMRFTQAVGSDDIYMQLNGVAPYKLTFADWVAAGYPQPQVVVPPIIKFAWSDNLYAQPTANPGVLVKLTFEQWAKTNFASYKVVTTVTGMRFVQPTGSDAVFVEFVNGVRVQLTFAEWVAAGQPVPVRV